MKRLILAALTLLVMACQQSGSNGGNTQVANPLGMGCINGSTYCNNSAYSQYQGWTPYPGLATYAYDYTNYFNQNGFCSCPVGYLPTLNAAYGLGCVSSQILNFSADIYIFWQWGFGGFTSAAPQTTTNFPQFSNIPGASNSASSCSRTLTQSCLLDQGNTCGAQATCRQAISGSNLGVCVKL